jgi:sigma-B regulation protein RsbU (phosphoserine phosphatase)
MFTDGVTESLNTRGEQFEEEGLINSFQAHNKKKPAEILDGIYKDIKNFSVNLTSQHDDITMLIIKRLI